MSTNKTKIILFDLDETIIYSEEIKTQAWNTILKPWGYIWGNDERTISFKRVPQESRPKTGIHPLAFIEQLIDKLQLQVNDIKFKNKTDTYLNLLEVNKLKGKNAIITIMLDEWKTSLVQETKKVAVRGKIAEVPGAVKIIKRLHKDGYKIGAVTQAPFEYAYIILKSLDLISSEGKETDRYLSQGKNVIDVIVSGESVKNPKSNPEALLVAIDLIRKKQRIITSNKKNINVIPYAMVGDSESDVFAGKAINMITVLINSRKLSHSELRKISPDIIINTYSQLNIKMLDAVFMRKVNR